MISNKTADKFVKPKPISDAKPSDVEKIGLSLKKKKRNNKRFKTYIKWNTTTKYLNY